MKLVFPLNNLAIVKIRKAKEIIKIRLISIGMAWKDFTVTKFK